MWAEIIRRKGYTVFNPAELVAPLGLTEEEEWKWYMKRCIAALMEADVVGTIDGWYNSKGARKEIEECMFFSIGIHSVEYILAMTPPPPDPLF